MDSLLVSFDGLEDPRVDRTKLFSISEIMFLILCAVISGVESWRGVEDFGEDRLEWLQKFLPFKNGIPSHQTIGRVMSLLKPETVTKAFVEFMKILLPNSKVDSKTNEITAVPKLLDMIEVKYATIIGDAMITQKIIAAKIISKEADYALALKGNHKKLEKDVQKAFEQNTELNTTTGNSKNFLFREDVCRVRKDHAPVNFSTIRKLALNLLRGEKSTKLSVPRKQARALRNSVYLEKITEKILNIKEI
jgi:predicted transposase YbfD/YdcC